VAVVGSGAAALNAAVQVRKLGIKDVVLLTAKKWRRNFSHLGFRQINILWSEPHDE
jgi:succinate dehydrogenase/fumarate reductase flavoprotein subunit